MLYDLEPRSAIVSDYNRHLILTYMAERDQGEAVTKKLAAHKEDDCEAYLYRIRRLDREKESFERQSGADQAKRFIYLNKTCYNGLFRVNAAGHFNTPFGRYKKPSIVNEPTLRAVHDYFLSAAIEFRCGDYQDAAAALPAGSFASLDPPHPHVSATAKFTGYTLAGVGEDAQLRP